MKKLTEILNDLCAETTETFEWTLFRDRVCSGMIELRSRKSQMFLLIASTSLLEIIKELFLL